MSDANHPTTVAEALLRRRGDQHRAVDFEGTEQTWEQVVQAALARAQLLQELRRDGPFNVGVLLENVPEYVHLLGAAAISGATIVGINPTRRGEGLARDVRHTDCQLVLTDSTQAQLLDGLDLGVDDDRVLLTDQPRYARLLDDLADAEPPEQLPAPDTLFTLIFTSGSTGAPKAVKCSQGRLAETTGMGFATDDVLYCAMPLFHGNALFANWYPATLAGATMVLRRRFSASGFLPDVRTHGVTYFNSVGRALSYIVATPPSPHDRDHQLRFGLAPEASPPDIAAFQERFGCPVIGGYGSSEGAIRMLPPPDAPPGALGTPVDPDDDVAVVDPETLEECPRARLDADGRLLNPGEAIGEIVSRSGASRFEGYWAHDEAEAERTRAGWFWSGDLAYRDEEGTFFFAGRTGDRLRVDGENFAAAPVERILARHPDVAAVAVYAVPDPVTGDQVMAALELEPEATFAPEGFAAFLHEQRDLGTKWAPRFVRLVDTVPTTGTDKVHKGPLRAAAWRTDDPVWWRPDRELTYTPFTAGDRDQLEATLAEHGRLPLLQSP